jgi:hypothetical protein
MEADTPLAIYPNAELICPVALQAFQSVAWQGAKIGEACRSVQNLQPLPSLPLKTGEVSHVFATREG